MQPELLDALSPTHPDALHNRRDLRLTNGIMRNHRWVVKTLPPLVRIGERALEIGAGDGRLAQRLGQAGVAVDAMDLWPPPHAWPTSAKWHQTDLREFAAWRDYDVVFGNLIFHQFDNADLVALGQSLAGARVILACEPTRRRISQVMYRTIAPLLGANQVTLHDAHVSIAAGFVDDELPRILGLDPTTWDVQCETTRLGAYRMVAVRRT